MTSPLQFIAILVVFFSIPMLLGRLFGSSARDEQRVLAVWRFTAGALGLRYQEDRSGGHMEGTYRGLDVHFAWSGDREGYSTRLHVASTVRLPEGFSLAPEGLRVGLMGLLGKGDIALGDAALDDALELRGADPEAVLRLLRRPTVLRALTAMVEDDALNPALDQEGLCCTANGRLETERALRRWLDLAADLMQAFREAPP